MSQSIYPASFIKQCNVSDEVLRQLPSAEDIAKLDTISSGVGIFAMRPFYRGERIGKFIGLLGEEVKQHTLQRSPQLHIHDPYFVGFLLHSCSPNCVLDMHEQEVFCVRDIAEGEPLTMDYASTEDTLFKQFACCCEAPNCREWVTGRAEGVNEEGVFHIAQKEGAPLPYRRTAVNGAVDVLQ